MPSQPTSILDPDARVNKSATVVAETSGGVGEEGVSKHDGFEAYKNSSDGARQELTQALAAVGDEQEACGGNLLDEPRNMPPVLSTQVKDFAEYRGLDVAGPMAFSTSTSTSTSTSRHDESAVWKHDSRQFQSAVGQLRARAEVGMAPAASPINSCVLCPMSRLDQDESHLMVATTGGGYQFQFSCDSCGLIQYGIRWNCARCQIDRCFLCRPPALSGAGERLQRVQADLQLAAQGTELLSSRSCKHCYAVFQADDELAQHAARCCYNPDLVTDHWKERWRCEFCTEIYDNFDDADAHERSCSFAHRPGADGFVYGTEI